MTRSRAEVQMIISKDRIATQVSMLRGLWRAYLKECDELCAVMFNLHAELKKFGNCPFCQADLKNVTPGAKSTQKRRHGHPKNCLWLKLDAEVKRWRLPKSLIRKRSTKK
jgi:hypothetical protein